MPFKRATKPKRKTFRRKSTTTRQLAIKALAKVNKINKGIEKKTYDVTSWDGTLASAGNVFKVVAFTNGTGDEQMIGDKVQVHYFKGLWALQALTAATTNFGHVRLILFQCKDYVTGNPAVTDILETAAVTSMYKKDSPIKFRKLIDRTYYLTDSALGTGTHQHIVNFSYKWPKGTIIEEDGANSRNNIYLLAVHNYENEDISLQGSTRTVFTDA